MEYEKLYNTVDEYNEAEGTGDVTSTTPGNCYIVENNVCKYNKDWDDIYLIYDVRDISQPTRLFTRESFFKTNLKRAVIDDKVIPISQLTQTWQFNETGKHKVIFSYSDKTAVYTNEYTGCGDLIYVNLPKSISQVQDSAFSECPRLQTIILNYPGKVAVHETSQTLTYAMWTRSFDQSGNQIKELKVPADQVAAYRASTGTTYGSLYIMPLDKSIKSIDWGKFTLNLYQNSNGTTSYYDFTIYESNQYVVPALTDYIEIDSATTVISFYSGNLNYRTPFRGAFSIWYLLYFDENKNIVGSPVECFHKGAQEANRHAVPEGAKYIKFNFLWQSIDETTLKPYDKWPRYAHIKDADTGEIIWPKVTYA